MHKPSLDAIKRLTNNPLSLEGEMNFGFSGRRYLPISVECFLLSRIIGMILYPRFKG